MRRTKYESNSLFLADVGSITFFAPSKKIAKSGMKVNSKQCNSIRGAFIGSKPNIISPSVEIKRRESAIVDKCNKAFLILR